MALLLLGRDKKTVKNAKESLIGCSASTESVEDLLLLNLPQSSGPDSSLEQNKYNTEITTDKKIKCCIAVAFCRDQSLCRN